MKYTYKFLLILLLVFKGNQASYAQSSISGIVVDQNGKAVQFVNVSLLDSVSSRLVQGEQTNKNGEFFLKNITKGNYFFTISFIGYKRVQTPVFNIAKNGAAMDMGKILLIREMTSLSEVTIVSKNPLIEQKIDRRVINVKNSISSAGSTALEILEKSPGVSVNQQNNTLSMNGKSGVVLMIDGKVTNIPATAVVQMLSSMSANNIEKIEQISSPPSNLDAEGNGGFINIILKKNPNNGFTATSTLTAGFGKGAVGAASADLFFRRNKLNLFLDYAFTTNSQKQIITNFRSIYQANDQIESTSISNRAPETNNNSLRLGADYQANKSLLISAELAGYNNHWNMVANNQLTISKNGTPDTVVSIKNNELNIWKHFRSGVNVQSTLNKEQKLTFGLDYLFYSNENPNTYLNNYFAGTGAYLYQKKIGSDKETPIKIWVGTVNYFVKIGKKIDLESGIKTTMSRINNNVSFSQDNENTGQNEISNSNKYNLNENINAAYTSMKIDLNGKTMITAGLRYEYTNSMLSVGGNNILNSNYGSLFPSLFISKQIGADKSIGISYNKRITRPTFNDLAPFTIYLDPNTLFIGNATLKPAITDQVKASLAVKNFYFDVGYTYENRPIAGYQPEIDLLTNTLFLTSNNLFFTQQLFSSISFPFEITKWWNVQSNITGTLQRTKGQFLASAVEVKKNYVNISSTQNFLINPKYAIELSGYYQSSSIDGIQVSRALGSLNFGIQRKIGINNDKLRFTITDLLKTVKFISELDNPANDFYTKTSYLTRQRTFRLTYTHNFGKQIKKTDKNSSSEEEQNRVHN